MNVLQEVRKDVEETLRIVENEIDAFEEMQKTDPNKFAAVNGPIALHWWKGQEVAYVNCLDILRNLKNRV